MARARTKAHPADSDEHDTIVAVRFPRPAVDQLRAIARAAERSLGAEVRHIVNTYLAHRKGNAGEPAAR